MCENETCFVVSTCFRRCILIYYSTSSAGTVFVVMFESVYLYFFCFLCEGFVLAVCICVACSNSLLQQKTGNNVPFYYKLSIIKDIKKRFMDLLGYNFT